MTGVLSRNRPESWLTNPPGHLWRGKWTALRGPLSRVLVSFLEIYNEEIDLRLQTSPPPVAGYIPTLPGFDESIFVY